jgi:hypothetical protein
MFNKTVVFPTKPYGNSYTPVTVTEKRAPTDDSVRLLKEMEEKALEKIVNSISIRDCQVDCQILVEKSYINQSNHYMIVYSMNGKKGKVQLMIHEYELEDGRETIVAERLRDLLAKDIATIMIGDAFVKAMEKK